jgi:hypothetical protein
MIGDKFAITVRARTAQPIAHGLVNGLSLYQDRIIPSDFRDRRWDEESSRESPEVSPCASIADYQPIGRQKNSSKVVLRFLKMLVQDFG